MKNFYLLGMILFFASCTGGGAPAVAPGPALPDGYKAPASGNKCEATADVTRGFGETKTISFVGPEGFKQSESKQFAKNAGLLAPGSGVIIGLTLSNFEPGTYTLGYREEIVNKIGASLLVNSEDRSYYSFGDEFKSKGEIVIAGNAIGYVWGTFSGTLHATSPPSSVGVTVSGKFVCKAP